MGKPSVWVFGILPRRNADYRALLWVAAAISLIVVQYCHPHWAYYLWPLSCYLAIACGTITHNHNHRATFNSRFMNDVFGNVLTIFYGYPTMMWIPTHNINHHHYVNRPGDATITWRYTNRHNLFVALTYFFVSSYFQSEPIQRYIRRAKQRNIHLYARIMFQYAFFFGFHLTMLLLAVWLYFDQRMGIKLWFLAIALPAFSSVSTIMFFNYIQHVHTDAWSEHNHSRNFVGRGFNFFFFNNGYHTAHHEHPGLHWSELAAAHARVAPEIAPQLIETNLPWFLFRQYVLATFIPRFGSQQIGAEPTGDTTCGFAGAVEQAEPAIHK